jgi:hypothetical protein
MEYGLASCLTGVERNAEAFIRVLNCKFATQFHDRYQRSFVVEREFGNIREVQLRNHENVQRLAR